MVILIVLVLVGGVAAQVFVERTQRRGGPPLSSNDADGGGALALARWMQDLGFRVDRLEDGRLSLDEVDVLLILEPIRRFDEPEGQAILDWVRRGGTLVYVPGQLSLSGLIPTP